MSGKGTALTTRQLSEMDHLHTQMKDKMSQVDEENTQVCSMSQKKTRQCGFTLEITHTENVLYHV